MKLYTPGNPPPKVRLECGPSKTKQGHKKECDINEIMAHYKKTGYLPVTGRQAFYADVSEMGDYRSALDNVIRADRAFGQLPAELRKRFDNDPAKFLDWCADPENRDEMVELGLVERETDLQDGDGVPVPELPKPGDEGSSEE